jgi:alkylation response protein AidB-like acyl-CoA dehydrogenase
MSESLESAQLQESSVRADVSAWLEANWTADQGLIEWRTQLVDSGWGMPEWPADWYGRDFASSLVRAVEQEFARKGAIGVARSGIRLLAAATLLEHGSTAHKEQFLRRILTGEDAWCQLFSEPGSGSDLAGATTRADLDGDQWVVNGQKLWTTSAHHADWGLLLARTDWDVPKHEGLSYFVIDMHQPGVEVQPLAQMNGHASFNQVYFSDAVVERKHLIGEIGNGWKVAMTTLAHERRGADGLRSGHSGIGADIERVGRAYDEERAETKIVMEPYTWYPQRAGRVDLLVPRALDSNRIEDATVRQELAKLLIMSSSAQWTARRARAGQQRGKPQGPEGSLGKLAASHVARAAARVHTLISGADAMLAGTDGAEDGIVAEILLSVPAVSIAGGTDEIQRNIIAERVLQMPKEPRFDTGPFRDVPKNVSTRD